VRLEPSPPLCIRPHQPADYRWLCRLVESAFEEWRGRIGNEAFVAALDDILARESLSPGQILVAEHGGLVVGTVTFHGRGCDRSGLLPEGWSAAHRLAVAPEARRQGVGRRLLEDCIARAKEDRSQALCLYSPQAMGPALALCERLGFRRIPSLDFRGRARGGDAPLIAQALYLPLG
jgi:predicted N-acetyltransferase YhbS